MNSSRAPVSGSEMFAAIWGSSDPPYPFQQRVAELLIRGRRVILQAPTGSGKTRAALTPYLYAQGSPDQAAMPRKCLYSVPMRVLATQFYCEQSKAAEAAGVFTSIQTGDQPKDPKLEADLVFMTIDQLLSSFLTMPYSLPRRLANLNAGAVAGSYIVMDEFHLFDPASTLPTALDMLVRLHGIAPALIMTATLSVDMLFELASVLGAEVVVTPPDEVAVIETSWGTCSARERTWRVAEEALSAEAVLAAHRKRSLVVCNQVEKARRLYDDLQGKHPNVVLLHSRFLQADRRQWETAIRAAFKRDSDAELIAVTTQVVEVGLDISVETLHTELAPASSMIQRAGRCARYPGQRGEVIVYATENSLPYARKEDDPLAAEMKAAWMWLREKEGWPLGFPEEQDLVNTVCGERDRRIIAGLKAAAPLKRGEINRVLGGKSQTRHAAELIRDAESRRLLINDHPDRLVTFPFDVAGFSLHPSVLSGAYKKWQERAGELELPWVAKRLVENLDPDEKGESRYAWEPVREPRELFGAGLVVVHPALAGYDPRRGLLLQEATGFQCAPAATDGLESRGYRRTSYRLEPYLEHVGRLIQALEAGGLDEASRPAQALERAAGWATGALVRLLWLVCALHDVGKLSVAWQGWTRKYHSRVGIVAPGPVAHTAFDPADPAHEAAQKGCGPRPRHASEGAVAVTGILVAACGGDESLTRAAISAIARHHTPFATGFSAFRLEKEAPELVRASFDLLPGELGLAVDATRLVSRGDPARTSLDLLVRSDRTHEWLAYVVLARAVRLADQAGTAAGSAL